MAWYNRGRSCARKLDLYFEEAFFNITLIRKFTFKILIDFRAGDLRIPGSSSNELLLLKLGN